MKQDKSGLKINVTLSIIMEIGNTSKETMDTAVRLLIDDLKDRYIEYKIEYQSMDVDIQSENKVYIKFSVSPLTQFDNTDALENVGECLCLNLERRLLEDNGLNGYHIEKVNHEIVNID